MLSNMSVRAERKRQTRAELLRAARTVIAAKGFTATTARDVALEAGVAVGTVFVHFPTMAVLAEELLDETIGPALDAAVRTMPEQAGLVDRLVHVSLVLYQAYDADAELSRQVLSGSLFESSPGSTSQRRMADFQEWVAQQVDAAVAAGEIAPINGEEAFAGFFALYFAVLVGGLRGDLDAATRPVLLRSLLGRLLRPTSGR
jgi:AcrR family transcriptional regulator